MHISVLKEEAVKLWGGLEDGKKIKPGVYVDATFGDGGHSEHLLNLSEEVEIKIIGFDWDPKQIKKAEKKYKKYIDQGKLFLFQKNYSTLEKQIEEWKEKQSKKIKVQGILFDLGVSSSHYEKGKGFSFHQLDDPLDMRFNPEENPLTAADILNYWDQEEIEKIIKEKGEEKYSRLVVRKIIEERRAGKKFKTVSDLVETLKRTLYRFYKNYHIHFATRTFQALRMTVNREEENIIQGLEGALNSVDKGGRIVAISFHSGEDRIVKNFFRNQSKTCICPPLSPICQCDNQPKLKILTKRPLIPGEEEISKNPRSRSSRLRAAIKI